MSIDWDEFKDTADEGARFHFKPPTGESIPTRVSLKDWLLSTVFNGTTPLFILSVVVTACMAKGAQDWAALLGVVPLFVWFSGRLLNFGGRWRPWIAALSYPFLLLASAAAMVLPTIGRYQVQGDPIHAEILVLRLQENLESGLTWPALFLYLGVLLGALAVESYFTRRSPWLEAEPAPKSSIAWRVLVVFSLLAWGGILHSKGHLSTAEKAWLMEMEQLHAARPFRTLTESTEPGFWQKQIQAQSDGAPYRVLSLSEHPPTSQQELEAADSYFSRGIFSDLKLLDRVDVFQTYATLALQKRPNGNREYLAKKIHSLASEIEKETLDLSQLEQIRLHLDPLKNELFSRPLELDFEAYRTLWIRTQETERAIGWFSPEEIRSWQPGPKKDWHYNGVTQAKGLRAFGQTLTWSPTIWLREYQRVQLTRQWIHEREVLEKMPLAQQLQRLEELRDGLGHLDSREFQFWDSQLRENQITGEFQALEKTLKALEARARSLAKEGK